jgi:uncharacterized lipoprotein YehR (DUF1307 family)
MNHFSKHLVILASLAFAAAGCGGGSGEEDTFTQEQAGQATSLALVTYVGGSLLAIFSLGGQSGDFDFVADCEGGGTTRFSGSIVIENDAVTMLDMDAEDTDCGGAMNTTDGTLHFEGTTESVDISGSYTFSGDILSGTCAFDVSATFSDDGQSIDVTGTACGHDVSGAYTLNGQ